MLSIHFVHSSLGMRVYSHHSFQIHKFLLCFEGVPLAPGRPVVQLSSRTEPQDENSVTDEINITWAVPKDDGGFPITGYKIEMLDIQTNNWIEITFIEVQFLQFSNNTLDAIGL